MNPSKVLTSSYALTLEKMATDLWEMFAGKGQGLLGLTYALIDSMHISLAITQMLAVIEQGAY
jgi:hypothetical protein